MPEKYFGTGTTAASVSFGTGKKSKSRLELAPTGARMGERGFRRPTGSESGA
jgi:hypothetical protein